MLCMKCPIFGQAGRKEKEEVLQRWMKIIRAITMEKYLKRIADSLERHFP